MNETPAWLKNPLVNTAAGLILAVIFSYFYYASAVREAAFKKDGVETTGVVVDVREDRGRKGRITRYPIIEFQDQSGNTHKFESPSSKNVAVDSSIEITYSASNPSIADIKGGGLAWISALVALGCLVYGIVNGVIAIRAHLME